MNGTRIADLAELATDDTFLFRVRPANGSADGETDAADASGGDTSNGGEEREAILLRLADEDGDPADEAVCWLNYCQHMTHIKLDKGSGAPVRGGEVVCANHGAMFDCETGRCTYGPCEDAYLNEIDVAVADGGVHLVDEDYEFVGTGQGDGDGDMSSSSNVIL